MNGIGRVFHLLKTKLKRKCTRNKQELKAAAVKAWQSTTSGETQPLVMFVHPRLQAVVIKYYIKCDF